MSNPWMKFYPSDWRADPALRMCSLGARGLWMEMLCLMHEAEGFLTVNGKELVPRQLAALSGASVDDVTAWLVELSDAGVFSRDERGFIYSRRMLKDLRRAAEDKANGRKGGNPALKGGVNPPVGGGDKAQKPEARSQKLDSEKKEDLSSSGDDKPAEKNSEKAVKKVLPFEYPGEFEMWWAEYPRHKGTSKAEAYKSWKKLTTADQDAALEGAIAYAESCRAAKTEDRFICHPCVFLNQRRWETLIEVAQ